MRKFEQVEGVAAVLLDTNIDTDQILPKQFLRTIEREGLGKALFFDFRYTPDGDIIPGFELNKPDRAGAVILLTGENFGCGSSREHAVWALADFGIRCVVAPSFAEIFATNALGNGLLLIALPAADVQALAERAAGGGTFRVDLPSQRLVAPDGGQFTFEIDQAVKARLLDGLDAIALTLRLDERIAAHEARLDALALELHETTE